MDNFDKNNEKNTTDFIVVGAPYDGDSETNAEKEHSASWHNTDTYNSDVHTSETFTSQGANTTGTATVKQGSKYITKKVFVITIILAMLATSFMTAFVMKLSGGGGGSKEISATNYTLAKATGSELSVQEVIAKNENAVVEIRTESIAHDSWLSNYVTTGAGSGVIVDTDGYILTCNHVVADSSKIVVRLKNGKEYDASIVGADPQEDVAVIKTKFPFHS